MRGSLAVAVFLFTFTVGAALAQKDAPAGPPYRVGGEVRRPEKISGDPPAYTDAARRALVSGVVIVEAVIDEQGNVTSPRVLKGLPLGLERQAMEAVQAWKFKPATLRGRPVPVYQLLTATFHLGTDLSFGPRARKQASSGLDSTARYELVEMGLQAVDKALAARPDDIDAIATKRDLLRDKAMITSDGDQGEEGEEDVQATLDEANRLQQQVDELQDRNGALTFPEKISGDPAELTEMARKAGISGTVRVEAVIDEQGNVVDARIIEGLPMGLDEKALEAVRAWKFKPATAGGKPLKVDYTVTVTFR
jgi:TonB family protein